VLTQDFWDDFAVGRNKHMEPASSTEVSPATQIADLGSIDALLPTVYEELRELAEAVLQRCQPMDPTTTTSLIHNVYMRLAQRDVRFRDKAHFFCLAARAMRFVLIDRARRANAGKRAGDRAAVTLEDAPAPSIDDARMLAVDEALHRLNALDQRKGRLVELRFFGGLSIEETAQVMGLSPATVNREWAMARAWLGREIGH
jgi:RNA polymerase sigma factor (TIGR02999 family)